MEKVYEQFNTAGAFPPPLAEGEGEGLRTQLNDGIKSDNLVMGNPFLPSLARRPLTFDPFTFMEACVAKAGTSALAGAVMGAGMGMLFGSYSSITPPVPLPGVPDPPKIPMRYQMREAFLSTARKSRRWGKNFGMVTAVFSGIECVIEKYRAKHDIYNGVSAGCVTGKLR